MKKITVFWFRRDLRLNDNHGLFKALKENKNVILLFIFDETIIKQLPKNDARINYIYTQLNKINSELNNFNSSICIKKGIPLSVFKDLSNEYSIENVYCNHDYEPSAIKRDEEIKNYLITKNISFYSFKDQCIFEKNEVIKKDGTPYTVFTPYSRIWKATLNEIPFFDSKSLLHHCENSQFDFPSLKEIGFEKSSQVALENPNFKIENYENERNFPYLNGTSRKSIELRFGVISVRSLAKNAIQTNSEIYLNELIWRDFYMMILFHFPKVVNQSFKSNYDLIPWDNNEIHFQSWCNGTTGYPIVDAGMRELNETGFMHNRVRMITASFLCKHLLIDWRWGENYFATKLLDYDLAANNGGWQWAASSGCDAVPYFRIFNPTEQVKKFDKDLNYVKRWVPEFNSLNYPSPIIEHVFARNRALATYKKALNETK